MRRTTISIDDELYARLARIAQQRGCSFSAAFSDVARRGLGDQEPKPYQVRPYDGGHALVESIDDLARVLDLLDGAGTGGPRT